MQTVKSQDDLVDIGFDPNLKISDLVLKRAKLVKECGIDGVIASGLEASEIRNNINELNFIIVAPGIRLEPNDNCYDQKRVVDIKTAFCNGTNYIVVGRPITKSKNPKIVAEKIQQEISQIFRI